MIGMSERHFIGRFTAMDRNVANLDLKMEWDDVEAADFCTTAGYTLDFGDHSPANIGLKGTSGGVPKTREQQNKKASSPEQQDFPPARSPAGGRSHCACTPSAAPAAEGTLTLLSERRACSQETINSLTFSCVSNSRILPETSASGTSFAPASFNCSTNLS